MSSLLTVVFVFLFLIPVQVRAATFVVDSVADTNDVTPGDGLCEDVSNNCSLRASLEEANNLAGEDEITLPAGNYSIGSVLLVQESVTLNGEAANTTVIDANLSGQIFSVSGGATSFTINDIQVREGDAANGSFIRHQGNVLTLNRVHVLENTGGEIIQVLGGTFVIRASVFHDNNYSGSIILSSNAGSIVNSIFYDNISSGGSAVLSANDTVILNNILVTSNTSGLNSAIHSELGTINIQNSILNDNTGGNCSVAAGAINSNGYNIDSADTCGFASTGDLPNTNPLLGALDTTSYDLPFFPLLYNSPAREAGDNGSCVSTDSRDVIRPQGDNCDIGAFEGELSTVSLSTDTLSFEDQEAETVSGAQTVTLLNTAGDYPLQISSITLSDDFTQSNDCPDQLPVGDSCTISIIFSPSSAGTKDTELLINHDGVGLTTSLNLVATASEAIEETPTTDDPSVVSQYQGSSAFGCSLGTKLNSKSGFEIMFIFCAVLLCIRLNKERFS